MLDLILLVFFAIVFYGAFRLGAKYNKFSVAYAAAKAWLGKLAS
jgi:hypothetical protein